jgi:hypothetical protein
MYFRIGVLTYSCMVEQKIFERLSGWNVHLRESSPDFGRLAQLSKNSVCL